jgi:lipid II:glycine glycyltransferase (peptidoglycan interpeptide bridge formation enzyme)
VANGFARELDLVRKIGEKRMALTDNKTTNEYFARPSYLQSPYWADFQKSIGNEVLDFENGLLCILEKSKAASKLYVPNGPSVQGIETLISNIEGLMTLAKEKHLDFIRIEPRVYKGNDSISGGGKDIVDMLKKSFGAKKTHKDIQPSTTIINELDKDFSEIEAGLSQLTRRMDRKLQKAGVIYEVSYEPADIQHFLDMIHDVSTRTGMLPHSDKYFQNMAEALFTSRSAGLLFASVPENGKPKKIASIIFLYYEGIFYYAHAASFSEYRKLSPATGLGVFALKYAKELGAKYFDWFGAAPENASENHPWAGFTKFKLAFGGFRVSTIGTFDIPVKKFKYFVYSLALKVLKG